MVVEVSHHLEASDRAFQQLADQTIKKDPVRALVELITNSDDSYKKLERYRIENDGSIVITFKRARGSATIKITDHAEGMSSELMDQAVGIYGSETHGFEGGQGGRSFFGRGLKEAILSMGDGFVKSIQNNLFHQCALNITQYVRAVPKEASQYYKDELEIPSRGTWVALLINRQGIKIPQFETLKRSLELNYSLRDILFSPKRNVVLIELGPNNEEKNRVKLEYVYPTGDIVINKAGFLPGHETIPVSLEVRRSEEPLSGREEGYLRQSGILICSKGAIHDISLFKFENEELAKHLFGRLTCDYIDVLLRKNELVVLDSRDGLDWSHSFNKELRLYVEQELEKYILEEKKKQKEKRKPLESDFIRKKFKKALDKINAIAEAELKTFDNVGIGNRSGMMLPPNGFDFVPNYYHVMVDKKSTLTLKVTNHIARDTKEIEFTSESPNVRLLVNKVELDFTEQPTAIVHTYIEGKKIGEVTKITAKMRDIKTEATVHVVASKSQGSGEPRNPQHRGMFKDISYDPDADPHQRVRYESVTGTIIIATMAPSVKLYLNPNGLEGLEEPQNQVMTAELVTQAVCRELAKRKFEVDPGVGEAEETLNAIYNKLVDQYAHVIHSILGPLT